MTLGQARELFAYWRLVPPAHEMIAMLAQIYTTWRPEGAAAAPKSETEIIIEHRKSLEERWAAGALNVKQMFEATGGRIGRGTGGANMGGIGLFPGSPEYQAQQAALAAEPQAAE